MARGAWGRAALAAVTASAGVACGEPAGTTEVPALRAPACAADERPARDGMGYRCTRTGAEAHETATEGAWPKAQTDETPAGELVLYVRAGAEAGGDGSSARPFRTVAEAFALEPARGRTVLLSEGAHAVAATIAPAARAAILGMAPSRTSLVGAPGIGVLRAEGPEARVSMRGLTVLFPDAAMPGGGAVSVVEVRARARFDASNVSIQGMFNRGSTVSIQGMFNAVAVNGGVLGAQGLTVIGANNRGISLANGSTGTLREVLVRECGAGVVSEDSELTMSASLVADTVRGGVAVARTGAGGGAMAGAGALDDVAIVGNGVAGLRAEGAGARVVLARVLVSDTTVPAGLTGGDGLYVGAGASVTLDEQEGGACDGVARSAGSRLVGNARAGALVAGAAARLRACGAGVTENGGPGVFVQGRAAVDALRASELTANTGLGLGVSGASAVREVRGSAFHATRAGAIETAVGPLTLGDGVAVSQGADSVEFAENELSDNARFALVFSGGAGVVRANRGARNRYGIAAYAGGPTIEAGNAVGSRESAPAAAPAFAEQLGAAR